MSYRLIYFILLLSPAVLSKYLPRYADLDEEEQQLFRAAYDTPSYNHEAYEEDDLPLGNLDLVKDGLWAVKAKLKELKAFNKALAANMLSTKLKVKDLLKNHMQPLKNHHHVEADKKPSYSYQAPSYQAPNYQAPYPQPEALYTVPQYGHEPQPQYTGPHYKHKPQYAAPQYGHESEYAAPQYEHDPYYGQ